MMNPIDVIKQTRNEARNVLDANADVCFLALASPNGEASVRTLVLRDIIENRFSLFINQSSPKWQLLSEGASYQLLLWYPSQQRQFRISGRSEPIDSAAVRTNWQRRPSGSKYLDYVYNEFAAQSSALDSREQLTSEIERLKSLHKPDDMTPPDQVTGVELIANEIELLDLNSDDRIHDRLRFSLSAGVWSSKPLVP
ncbi:MAG: pyridoxamine 5'-phosphate oxidase family protein [Pseudomonadales bacterium]|nr:pyridoxamine 5'-phosphate oxidase family protein [Pseudomonadales bacterium]MDG1444450.1 pyridoxamine 5'-phosphate oxidase family protein [Pseudomonadales bacterium]